MKLTTRTGLAFFALTSLAAGAFAHPTLTESWGVDVWNVPALHDQFEREQRASRVLDHRSEISFRRASQRVALAMDVIDGRVSFREAIQLNLELSQSAPESLRFMREYQKGSTDLEKSAAQILSQVRSALDPRAKQVAEYMECEFALMNLDQI